MEKGRKTKATSFISVTVTEGAGPTIPFSPRTLFLEGNQKMDACLYHFPAVKLSTHLWVFYYISVDIFWIIFRTGHHF